MSKENTSEYLSLCDLYTRKHVSGSVEVSAWDLLMLIASFTEEDDDAVLQIASSLDALKNAGIINENTRVTYHQQQGKRGFTFFFETEGD